MRSLFISGLAICSVLLAGVCPVAAQDRPITVSREELLSAGRTTSIDDGVRDVGDGRIHSYYARTLPVDGANLYYEVIDGPNDDRPPLLILHGAYMSADAMKAVVDRFAATRKVIVFDQRGHGRTGDSPGPITYERLADDAAAVLEATGVERADVFGYSMGGGAAIQLAVRHPDLVGKLVIVSAGFRQDAMYPEVVAGIAQITPAVFAGSPIEAEYKRLSPTPDAFPSLVAKLTALDVAPMAWPREDMRAIRARTMIMIGDHDVVRPEHAVELFRLRGGADARLAAQGMLMEAPPARLAVLPATSHIGIMGQPDLVVALVTPFLDDVAPVNPEGFF